MWKSQLCWIYLLQNASHKPRIPNPSEFYHIICTNSVHRRDPMTIWCPRKEFVKRRQNWGKRTLAQSHASDDSKANKQNIPGFVFILLRFTRLSGLCYSPRALLLAKIPEKKSFCSISSSSRLADLWAMLWPSSAGIGVVTQSKHFSRNSCLCKSFSELKYLISSGLSLPDSENLIGNIPSLAVT